MCVYGRGNLSERPSTNGGGKGDVRACPEFSRKGLETVQGYGHRHGSGLKARWKS